MHFIEVQRHIVEHAKQYGFKEKPKEVQQAAGLLSAAVILTSPAEDNTITITVSIGTGTVKGGKVSKGNYYITIENKAKDVRFSVSTNALSLTACILSAKASLNAFLY